MNLLRTLKEKLDKRYCAFVLFLAAASLPLFAAGDLPGKMTTIATQVKDIMTGTGVRILLACFLAGSAVAYAFNKDNEKVKRNCIAVAVAAGILILASTLVDWVITVAGS
jgi:peptidoglycan/LPS O-acetylase OafA/YrhL